MLLEAISSFEKAVVCNSLHTDTHLHRCTPSTFLYSTLIEMKRHKVRCGCKQCVGKASELMSLIRMVPQITSPRATDKEMDGASFGSSSFHEGWEICEKIFELIQTCHSVPHSSQSQCHVQAFDIDKLTSFFPTKIEIQNKTDSLASGTFSEPWKDYETADTSDDDYPSLE